MILLPETTFFLKDVQSCDICTDKEEHSVYFKNIIYPYSEEYDVLVECDYGKNLGNCWRIDSFPDGVNEFELKISVCAPYGKCVAQGKTTVRFLEKKRGAELKLLCIGDSMTFGEEYVEQAAAKAKNIRTIGTRQVKRSVFHEGRGGWCCGEYLQSSTDTGKGVSPFLFPKSCEAEEYFGDKTFCGRLAAEETRNGYTYTGFASEEIKDGMYVYDGERLLRFENGKYVTAEEKPCFEFSFEKYLRRYGIPVPDVVSLLFGANEFQLTAYENAEREVGEYIENMKKIVAAVRSVCPACAVAVNLPVTGSEQFAWGMQLGCRGRAKRYEYIIKLAARALLDEFDGRSGEGIYVCSMLGAIDPEAGYASGTYNANIYSEKTYVHQTNWVHPNRSGYKQMGDALAGVLAAVRERKEENA